MDPVSPTNIRDILQAGRIIEAKTLLTMHSESFPEEEVRLLEQELTRRSSEAEALIVRAEAMEKAGRTEEAKALYQSVLLFASDFPGIHSHIKQMEDSLFLTKAVKRRSRRIRESTTALPETPQAKKKVPLRVAGLAVILSAVFLFLLLARNQPQNHNPLPAPPAEPLQSAAIEPAAPSKEIAPTIPEEVQVELAPPVALPPADLPVTEEPQPSAPDPQQVGEAAAETTEPPLSNTPPQNTGELYTVQIGDSLSLIAIHLFCNRDAWKKIYQLNREKLPDPNKLQPGIQLQLKDIENRCLPTHSN